MTDFRDIWCVGRRTLAVSLLLLISACATPQTTGPGASSSAVQAEQAAQEEFLMSEYLRAQDRIGEVGNGVLFASADWCGPRTASLFGFFAPTLHDIPADAARVAQRGALLSYDPVVRAVARTSPAHQAGMQVGDKIVSINGTAPSVAAIRAAAQTMHAVPLVVERRGETVTLHMSADRACNVPIQVNWDEETNAFTDGEKIVINRGMLNLATSDDELAAVVGHELAHILSGHLHAKQTNAIGGGVGGLLLDIAFAAAGVNTQGAFTNAGMQIGAGAYSQDFEREADYVGGYFAAAAGYDIGAGSQIWRRIGSVDPRSLAFAGTHPSTPERFVALSNTAAEIRRKAGTGEPIAPSGWTPKLD